MSKVNKKHSFSYNFLILCYLCAIHSEVRNQVGDTCIVNPSIIMP